MNDETTMLPCPFCGGEAEIDRYTIKPYVSCTKCGCSMPDRHQTAEQAIEAWNTRTPEQAIAATLGEVDEGCYLMRDGKKFPVELDYGFIGIMPITITVGGFRYLLEVPDGK